MKYEVGQKAALYDRIIHFVWLPNNAKYRTADGSENTLKKESGRANIQEIKNCPMKEAVF